MSVSVKSTSFSDRNHSRQKILDAVLRRVKADREQIVKKIRGGQRHVNELAKEVLANTFIDGRLPFECGSSTILESFRNDENLGCMSYDDEKTLVDYLGSEDHELLMYQIAEALQLENIKDIDENELSLYEDRAEYEDHGLLQQQADICDSDYLICPICRVSHMKVSGAVGECSCGVTVNLQDEDSGVIITTDMLCNRLGIVFDRHSELCDHEVKISLVNSEDNHSTENCDEMYADTSIRDGSMEGDIPEGKYGHLTASCLYCGLYERIV